MSVVTASIEIEAPVDLVWEVVSDPRNLPHWERHIVRVTGVQKQGLREGSRYTTEMRFMAVRANVKATSCLSVKSCRPIVTPACGDTTPRREACSKPAMRKKA